MKKSLLISFLLLTLKLALSLPLTPRELYKDLFDSIQLKSIFADQKTFVDCIPKEDPVTILELYHSQKAQPDFNLRKFVNDHFNLPPEDTTVYSSSINAGVVNHINELWPVLLREPIQSSSSYSSLLPLPYPYIIPGGRFREIYYWDSYFTMLGLKESRDTLLIENMVKNFAALINRYGIIPNGNRTYYLSRSQPPFFSLMVDLLADMKGGKIYIQYLPFLLKEYNFWMKGSENLQTGQAKNHVVNINGPLLNRYWDNDSVPREESFFQDVEASKASSQSPGEFYRNIRSAAESGWDFSSRWFTDGEHLATIQTTDLIPVDLNCLLYHLEKTIAKACSINGDHSSDSIFELKSVQRKQAIMRYCWNHSEKFFCDYNFTQSKHSDALTLAGMFPLYFDIADEKQAADVMKIVKQKFLDAGGVVTTLKNTGQQWDAPNGWAPLEYITIEGLYHYDYKNLAEKIASRWIQLNTKIFNDTGKLMEKYNVENINVTGGGGEYPLQDGFGWTNGVLLKLINEYGQDTK